MNTSRDYSIPTLEWSNGMVLAEHTRKSRKNHAAKHYGNLHQGHLKQIRTSQRFTSSEIYRTKPQSALESKRKHYQRKEFKKLT